MLLRYFSENRAKPTRLSVGYDSSRTEKTTVLGNHHQPYFSGLLASTPQAPLLALRATWSRHPLTLATRVFVNGFPIGQK